MEDKSQQLVIGFVSEEESVFCDQRDKVLKVESQVGSILLILSLDDDFDEEDLKNDGNEFFEGGKVISSGFEPEVTEKNVADFALIKLENAFQNNLNLVGFENKVLVSVIR